MILVVFANKPKWKELLILVYLLQQVPIPADQFWHTVSKDFVEGLPSSSRENCIMVIVDKFFKYANFLSLSHPFILLTIAKLFKNNIYKLHGLPTTIVSHHKNDLMRQSL